MFLVSVLLKTVLALPTHPLFTSVFVNRKLGKWYFKHSREKKVFLLFRKAEPDLKKKKKNQLRKIKGARRFVGSVEIVSLV